MKRKHTLDELQDILHSNPLTTLTSSITAQIAESSSKSPYLGLFLSRAKNTTETYKSPN
jgi:hypothetical protein